MDPRADLFVGIAEALTQRAISTAVLNGCNPETLEIGRDVDLLVRRNDLRGVLACIIQQGKESGWGHINGRWMGTWIPKGLYQLTLRKVTDSGVINLTIDLICSPGIGAGIVQLYSDDLLKTDVRYRNGIPFTPIGSYMKNSVLKVLAGLEKGYATAERLEFTNDIRQYMRQLFGEGYVRSYEQHLRENILRKAGRMLRWRAQLAFFARHPLTAFRNLILSLVRRIIGSRAWRVPTVAVVGPDGVGKTTAIEFCEQFLIGAYLKVRRRHWRPRLLPDLNRLFDIGPARSVPNGLPVPPRRTAGQGAIIRRLYYWADYFLGYWLKDRYSVSSEITINLYDRCALDMVVDPVRFGLTVSTMNIWPFWLSHRPDWVVLLTDAPSTIHGRKSELSENEIQRQLATWHSLVKNGFVQQVITVENRPVSEVGNDLACAILQSVSTLAPV
ncbi:MAG: hypothetical protein ACYC5Y_15615 [Symbiobacteriia bacterium]